MSLPPVEIPLGAMRFNSDSQKLEYFNGDVWMQVHTFSPNLGGNGGPSGNPTGNSADYSVGARACIGGGIKSPLDIKDIDYVNIASAGNAVDFGDLIREQRHAAGMGSSTRGIFSGGYKTSNGGSSVIEYVSFSTIGNSVDFGDTQNGNSWSHGTMANATRGIVAGGAGANDNTKIQYFTMASTGDAVDFDADVVGNRDYTCVASPTRGIITGGHSGSDTSAIKFITMATTGTISTFGSLTKSIHSNYSNSTGSSSTRGVIGPKSGIGYEYVTFATTGNSVEFGEPLTTKGASAFGAMCSTVRMLTAGGNQPSESNSIEYLSIPTGGLAVDFGNLTANKESSGGCSNGHGGL